MIIIAITITLIIIVIITIMTMIIIMIMTNIYNSWLAYKMYYKPSPSSKAPLCLCTPLCASWTKYGTLEHNYSLLQLYKALISTASLVLRRLFGVANSMFSFPMATMVGLPFIIMHDGLTIVGHAQIINSPPRIFVKLVFIL